MQGTFVTSPPAHGENMQWGLFRSIIIFLAFISTLLLPICDAISAEYSQQNGIIGAIGSYTTKADDSLIELARKFGLGYNEIVAANPTVDPILPALGTKIVIPSMWILPDVPHQGIVINISEMRLYYFPPGRRGRVLTYPVGIGDEGWETPTGDYRIIEKIVNPTWHVPLSIQRQKPELPAVVPPGPDNPLGTRALRLSLRTILIHGTNHPFGIGRKVSHGCIHLYPEDIIKLFRQAKIHTKVTIIRQPVKAAVVGNRLLVEMHGDRGEHMYKQAYEELLLKGYLDKADPEKLITAASEKIGMPEDVSW